MEGGEHRGAPHRSTVIRVQYHLIVPYRFVCAKVRQDFAGQHTAFLGIELPADNLAAEDIEKQIGGSLSVFSALSVSTPSTPKTDR